MSMISKILGEDVYSEGEVLEALGCSRRFLADIRRARKVTSMTIAGVHYFTAASLRTYLLSTMRKGGDNENSRPKSGRKRVDEKIAREPQAGPITSLDMFRTKHQK